MDIKSFLQQFILILLFIFLLSGCSSLNIDSYPPIPQRLIHQKTFSVDISPQKVLYNEISQTFIILGSSQNSIYIFNKDGELLHKINKFGEIDEFGFVSDISIDTAGNIYALDRDFNKIFKFDEMGQYLSNISLAETREPELLEIKDNGNFLIYDSFTNEIYCLSYNRELRYTFGKFQLIGPANICSALDFNYVLDTDTNAIIIFDNFGSLINTYNPQQKVLSIASSKYFLFYLNDVSQIYPVKQDYLINKEIIDLSSLNNIINPTQIFIMGINGLGVVEKGKIHLFQFSK
ncbi:MAG: 6-bladed beta-propeller [Candidatus Cloacimonetes bacterium]|nr:6-bladed beta-propeller [Candidatus Cloacimonadota bacterium]MBS3767081.1 6-bladed beta-propeller [Candidatus Cloacimonadota bacterium]